MSNFLKSVLIILALLVPEISAACTADEQTTHDLCIESALASCNPTVPGCRDNAYTMSRVLSMMNEVCCCPNHVPANKGQFRSCRAKNLTAIRALKGSKGLLLDFGDEVYRFLRNFKYSDCPSDCEY